MSYPFGGRIPLPYHHMMLASKPRMAAFTRAIAHWVKPGDVVLEAGTGTGILSALAAKQGAKKVYAVELDHELALAARRTMELNGLSDVVSVVQGRAEELSPPEPVDVVICEMMHVGLMNEQQMPVMAAVLQNLAARQDVTALRAIPLGAVNAAQLMEIDYVYEGLHIPVIRSANPYGFDDPRLAPASEAEPYWVVNFLAPEAGVDTVVRLTASRDATINGVQIITKTIMTDDFANPANDWYLWTMQFPIAPREVKAGEVVAVRIAYVSGCELERVTIEWTNIP